MQFTPSDTARLAELRAKMYAVLLPPQASIAALRLASGPLVAGSLAEHFFRRQSLAIVGIEGFTNA